MLIVKKRNYDSEQFSTGDVEFRCSVKPKLIARNSNLHSTGVQKVATEAYL